MQNGRLSFDPALDYGMASRPTGLTAMTICWQSETPHLFSATLLTEHGRHFLVVERLPDVGWDWVTWGEGRHRRTLHGTAVTAAQAMDAAGRAVRVERGGSVHVLPLRIAAGLHC